MVKPSVIGLQRSFGFGDRLGLATPGHLDALKGSRFAPVFAQQSIRELKRTGRQPDQVMHAAADALMAAGWTGKWGADADHLQTREDVQLMARHGFTFFTIDPSHYVNDLASALSGERLAEAYNAFIQKNAGGENAFFDRYLHKKYALGDYTLVCTDEEELMRAVLKYGEAIIFAENMYHWIQQACQDIPVEVELSVDETDQPTSPLEHLIIGLELRERRVKLVSMAPRFVGAFEKGIDYKGALDLFTRELKQHVAIAGHCGPYKLSMHSGSDKFRIYPIFSRICGELMHVKTAGTSYLEALRVICRTDRPLFRELVGYCRSCYERDRATYHVSARLQDVPENPDDTLLEEWYLENESGRQILHVTFGSVLSDTPENRDKGFKERVMGVVNKHPDLYRELLAKHLGKHLRLLS
jgi:hypothetical protein